MFILQFFFFIFIILLVVGFFIAVRIYITIRRTAGKFHDFANGGFRQQKTSENGTRYNKKNGNIIIDTRSDELKYRKIFPDNVGEFVKFKEIRS